MNIVRNLNFKTLFSKAYRVIVRVTLPRFKRQGGRVLIELPRRIENPDRIEFGKNVFLGRGSVVVACVEYKTAGGIVKYSPWVSIGDRVFATAALQIYCVDRVVIEDNVMFAANVFICDCSHGISVVDIPYRDQAYENIQPVRIGAGSWLGQNVVVMPGVTIGKYCVIGANAVVRESVPDYSMAVGAPARVVKVYDHDAGRWVRV